MEEIEINYDTNKYLDIELSVIPYNNYTYMV